MTIPSWFSFLLLTAIYSSTSMIFFFGRNIMDFTFINATIVLVVGSLWSLITLTAYLAAKHTLDGLLGSFGKVIAVLLFPLYVYLGIFYFPFWLIRLFRSDLKVFLRSTALLGSVLFILFDLFILSAALSNYLGKAGSHLATGHIKIPLEYTNSGHIKIWCSINGKEYPFFLDTGAGNLLFEHAENPLVTTDWSKLRWFAPGMGTSGDWFFKSTHKVGVFEIGGFQFKDYYFDVVDYNPGYCNSDIVGVIGKDLMSNFTWEINHTKGYILISNDQSGLSVFEKQDTIALNKNKVSDHLSLNLTINDTITSKFILDTGFNGSFSIGLDPNKVASNFKREVMGIGSTDLAGSSIDLVCYQIRSGKDAQGRSLFGRNMTAVMAPKRVNLIGNEILEAFDYVIDYDNSNLLLSKVESRQCCMDKSFGFAMYLEGEHARVKNVVQHSVADSLQIRPDMKILKLNGKKITPEHFCDLKLELNEMSSISLYIEELKSEITLHKQEMFQETSIN